MRGSVVQSLLGFPWERQGRSLGLASLSDPGRMWAKGVVVSFLVPGPGMIYDRGGIGLVCEN